MIRLALPVVLFSFILGACITEGKKDISGKNMGVSDCVDMDASKTKVDWRTFGNSPQSAKVCNYGDRSTETVKFRNS